MTDAKKEEKKNDVTPVKFKLATAHTHKGEDFKEGDTIKLCKYQADHLVEIKVGSIVNG